MRTCICNFCPLSCVDRGFQSSFLFSVVWSVGACVDTDSRVKFDAFFKDLMAGKNEEHPIPSIVGKIEAPIPLEGLVYDYLFEVKWWLMVTMIVLVNFMIINWLHSFD